MVDYFNMKYIIIIIVIIIIIIIIIISSSSIIIATARTVVLYKAKGRRRCPDSTERDHSGPWCK